MTNNKINQSLKFLIFIFRELITNELFDLSNGLLFKYNSSSWNWIFSNGFILLILLLFKYNFFNFFKLEFLKKVFLIDQI